MGHTSFEIVETPDDASPFQVVVKDGDQILFSAPADSASRAQEILLVMTAGGRLPKASEP